MFDSPYRPKKIGEITEAYVLAHLVEHGYQILKPWGDSLRYDLAVELSDSSIIKIQCKTARFKKKPDKSINSNVFEFSTCSTNWNQGTKKTYKGEVDLFEFISRH